MEIEKRVFPIRCKGKTYKTKEECDEVWQAMFESTKGALPEAFIEECGLYVAEGIYVWPDGEMNEW